MSHRLTKVALAVVLLVPPAVAGADWPTLRGSNQRTGYVDAEITPPFRLAWCRYFTGERIGSAVEPIVADGKVFIGTHSGNLYALDADTGAPLWRFRANGPIAQAPASADGRVVVADATFSWSILDASNGKSRGGIFGPGGMCAASPVVADGALFTAARSGQLICTNLQGEHRWSQELPIPVRQTAAAADGRLFVAAEDMRVRGLDLRSGKVLWTSEPLVGQTARDYYPVVAKAGDRTVVTVRTNPVIQMSRLIGMDRALLCRNAGLKDVGWKTVDAWCKSQEALGTPELWEREQQAILKHLGEHREARTFFVLDAETGKLLPRPPVLWIGGCQGVGTPPVVMPDGRLLVYYRTAYGNWTHGVAPLVGLGFLDLDTNRIEPLHHAHGMRPPWNTFWGTADESQNFVVARDTVICVHQGTLSGFDLKTRKLFLIWGNRDTWGGLKNLPWARNEWHGPARGGVAVVGSRIYWQTGSRILCIASGERGEPAEPQAIEGRELETQIPGALPAPDDGILRQALRPAAKEALGRRWAPLYVEPGLAGRHFLFDDTAELLEALGWLYAERCGEWERVTAAWPHIEACFDDFAKTNWRLDPAKGDLHANRYLASLIAYARIAEKAGDADAARQAKAMADETAEALVTWWQRSAEAAKLPVFSGIGEWDSFIGKGDAIFFKVRGHNSQIALFRDITPEVAALVKAKAPKAVAAVWHTFEALCPTWYLVGEERQVHFGENFVDPPDFALDAFKAYAWLRGASKEELARRVDIPFCKADLAFLTKLAIALDE